VRARERLSRGTHCGADQVCVVTASGDDGGLPLPDGGIAEMRSFGPGEFAAGQLIDMTFDAVRGSLTPSAYSYGGLIAHGLAGQHRWDATHTTWVSPASASATVAGLWRGDGFATGSDLVFIAGSADTTLTVWFEGEVWLDAASTERFGVAADEVAFVELAQPGTAAFSRVVANGTSTLKSVKLTLHTTGGPDKIARTASWTSQVIDATSNVIAIDSITWKARTPAGAGVQVQLRGCQQADCSDDPAWSGPATSGVAFAIVPARYLQLRCTLTSDGSHEPELQALAVMFRRS
jgi:hypothetical protein